MIIMSMISPIPDDIDHFSLYDKRWNMTEPNSEDNHVLMMISDHDLMTWTMIVKLC